MCNGIKEGGTYKGPDQSWAGFEISRVQDTARAVSSARQKKKKEKNSVWSIKVSWQKREKYQDRFFWE